ncbi:hypothetical protein AXF42_Ash020679 [Apostasia shenzhenica]|uniref:Uncharacterized protein n=1 Tax=Apostasia shenzhenica TaxID=1088818 RepID=A0A2I0ADY8_9ASPA|nr:hypothetical protein AXF42_Ash020679 [Apostasia shenzhenica]
MLKAKLVLFPEDFRPFCTSLGNCHFSFSFYSDNSMLDVPELQDDFDGLLTTDLALHLQPK